MSSSIGALLAPTHHPRDLRSHRSWCCTACARGMDVDKLRTLAKSVMVEGKTVGRVSCLDRYELLQNVSATNGLANLLLS